MKLSDLNPELRALVHVAGDTAIKSLAAFGQVSPVAVLHAENDVFYVPAEDFGSHKDQARFGFLIRALALTEDAKHVALISEAYVARKTPEAMHALEELVDRCRKNDEPVHLEDLDPSYRTEALLVVLESEEGCARLMIPIERSPGSNEPFIRETLEDVEVTYGELMSDKWKTMMREGAPLSLLYTPIRYREGDRARALAERFLSDNYAALERRKVEPSSEDLKRTTPDKSRIM